MLCNYVIINSGFEKKIKVSEFAMNSKWKVNILQSNELDEWAFF